MNLTDYIQEKKIFLLDGAMGTELAKRGLEPGDCPELLNIDNPDAVSGIADSYAEAGSDIVLTNTFGGSSQKLVKYDLADRLEELNEAGVRLAKDAAGGRALVFLSIGPTGEFLEPLGLLTEADLVKSFARQVIAGREAGADGVVLETMSDLGETIAGIKAVKDNSDLPVIGSLTFDKGVKGYATMMGVRPENAAEALERAGADGAGSNCGAGIGNLIEIAALMRNATGLPLWIKPNAGLPELVDGETVFRDTPEMMAERIPELVEAGVTFIGGCCGTTPEHIAAFREVIDGLK